jgi:hypothetical protein
VQHRSLIIWSGPQERFYSLRSIEWLGVFESLVSYLTLKSTVLVKQLSLKYDKPLDPGSFVVVEEITISPSKTSTVRPVLNHSFFLSVCTVRYLYIFLVVTSEVICTFHVLHSTSRFSIYDIPYADVPRAVQPKCQDLYLQAPRISMYICLAFRNTRWQELKRRWRVIISQKGIALYKEYCLSIIGSESVSKEFWWIVFVLFSRRAPLLAIHYH